MTIEDVQKEIVALENQIAVAQGALQAFRYVLDKLDTEVNPVDSVDTKEDSIHEPVGV